MSTPVTREVPSFATGVRRPAQGPRVSTGSGMVRVGVTEQDITRIEQLFAAGKLDGTGVGLADEVPDELDWWRTLANRRPMEFATSEEEPTGRGSGRVSSRCAAPSAR